jgi:ribosome-associated heat shock protein Hsp15
MAKARKLRKSAVADRNAPLDPGADRTGEADTGLCDAGGRHGAQSASPMQRLDKWLVYARFAKTRTAAAKLIDDGFVRLNGAKVTNAARAVGASDVLTLALPRATRLVRVRGVANRRGPFTQARALYEDLA